MKIRIARGGIRLGTWNHRVIRHDDGTLLIHEVHYDHNGVARLWSNDGAVASGATMRELTQSLGRMHRAMKRQMCVVKQYGSRKRLIDVSTGKRATNESFGSMPLQKQARLQGMAQLITDSVKRKRAPKVRRVVPH